MREYSEKALRAAWSGRLARLFASRHLPAVERPKDGMKARRAWWAFLKWCHEQGFPGLSFQAFGQVVGPMVKKGTNNGGYVWLVGEDFRCTGWQDPELEYPSPEEWIEAEGILLADEIAGWYSSLTAPDHDDRYRAFVKAAAQMGRLAWTRWRVEFVRMPNPMEIALGTAIEDAMDLLGEVCSDAKKLEAIQATHREWETKEPQVLQLELVGPQKVIETVAKALGWGVHQIVRVDVPDLTPLDSQKKPRKTEGS